MDEAREMPETADDRVEQDRRPILAGGQDGGPDGPLESPRDAGTASAEAVTLLIVEDDWLIAAEIEASVQAAGFRVAGTAVSADEAIALAERHRPDLVLMDIRLLGPRDGIDAAIEIRQRLDIPSLFVSAHQNDPGTGARARAARPLGWVAKPFSARQLVEAVENAARQERSRRGDPG